MSIVLVLAIIALLLAVASLIPNAPQHLVLAVAVILVAVALLVGRI